MARIKTDKGTTPQEEMFCREVAYMMMGDDLKKIGIDTRYEIYLYMAYKKAYPKTKASTASLQSMSSRLYKKIKIRSRIEEIYSQMMSLVVEATSESVSDRLNQMLALGPADFHIIDEATGKIRKRNEYELSVSAWWLVKRVVKYGYERLTLAEIVDILAKFKGWYKPQEVVNRNLNNITPDNVALIVPEGWGQ